MSAPLSPYIDATTPINSDWYQKGRLANLSKNISILSCIEGSSLNTDHINNKIGKLIKISTNSSFHPWSFDNGKVEVDTGSNTLDFILILLLVMSIYAGKKLIDKWIK